MSSPTLDFFSEQFDPLEALYSDAVELPYPQVKPLDNLAKCRAILPPELPESLAVQVPRKAASAESIAKHQFLKAKAAKVSEAATAETNATDAIQAVFDAVKAGPLQLLRKWHTTSTQVKVVTRHSCGVRGTAVGTIVAFDRFMNLVLRDVEETYTVLIKVERPRQQRVGDDQVKRPPRGEATDRVELQPRGGAGSSVTLAAGAATSGKHGDCARAAADAGRTGAAAAAAEVSASSGGGPTAAADAAAAPAGGRTRWCRKQEWRKRRLHQVFLKGDNIVLVSAAPEADSAPAAAGPKHRAAA